jgi:hypothetical protein
MFCDKIMHRNFTGTGLRTVHIHYGAPKLCYGLGNFVSITDMKLSGTSLCVLWAWREVGSVYQHKKVAFLGFEVGSGYEE